MKFNKWVFFGAILVSFTASADLCKIGNTYKTSLGATFTCVDAQQFGSAWKDPSGSVWSKNIGSFTNDAAQPDQNGLILDSPATVACGAIGGALPTADQYGQMLSHFERDDSGYLTGKGRKDLYAIFPDTTNWLGIGLWFWSSSVNSADTGSAYILDGYWGELDASVDDGNRSSQAAVRCIK